MAAPGIVVVRRRRAVRRAAADHRVRTRSADRPCLSEPDTDDRSPAERYADFRSNRGHPVFADFARTTTSRSTTSRSAPATRSRTAAACWWRRRPAPARRSSASSPIHLALATGRKASTRRRSRRCRTRSTTTSCARYGEDQVGLLTGDNTVNGEAPVVVMTTEVLRNMLYAGSRTLLGLGFVVMDEVHYLADRDRGRGVGGGHHPPARVGGAGLAVGDGLQRRGVRRVAGDGPRRHHDHRRGAAAGAALPARHGRPAAARPVRRLRRRRRRPGSCRRARRSTAS